MSLSPVLRPAEFINIALLAVIGGACLTGVAPILVRLAVADGAGPLTTAFWRFTFSLPALAVWTAFEGRRETRGGGGGLWGLALLAGVLFAGDLATWHAGIVRTDVANATLLMNLTPVLVGASAWALFGERPARAFVIGGAAALAGAALLSGAGFGVSAEAERATRALGDLLSALTAVWYAAYMIVVKLARAKGARTGWLMLASSAVGALTLGVLAVLAGEDVTPAAPAAWLWLVLLGVLVHAGGQGAIGYALGRLPAGLTALMILVQPVVAAAMAWVLFGEALGPLRLAGAAVVLAGLWMAARAPRSAAA